MYGRVIGVDGLACVPCLHLGAAGVPPEGPVPPFGVPMSHTASSTWPLKLLVSRVGPNSV